MHNRGGCTECFRIWWACACPNRCPECGAGYRDNSSCGTRYCRTRETRRWELDAQWARQSEAQAVQPAPAIQCDAVVLADPSACPAIPAAVVAPEPHAGEPGSPVLDGEAPIPARPRKAGARSNAEKRAGVLALLTEGLADREIARRAGVSPSTVRIIREAQS